MMDELKNEALKGFNNGVWQDTIDVRDFVVKNYTPYDGDSTFLKGPSQRTNALWQSCELLLKKELANNGVLDIDVSTITVV